MGRTIGQLSAAGSVAGTELVELQKLSASVTITATTLSAAASDNSFNDSGAGFVAAGFTVGMHIRVQGFTGNVVNNLIDGLLTAVTTTKLTVGGTDGDVIVDDAAGESVTITAWESVYTTASLLTGGGGSAGRHKIPVLARAMLPTISGGCAPLAAIELSAGTPIIATLNFDSSTSEAAQFELEMPKNWNEGTITFAAVWSHPSTTTNFGVVWGLRAVAISDGDNIGASFGTGVTVADTGGNTNYRYKSPESSAVTIAGTPAADDLVVYEIYRVPTDGSDTLAVDARLHAVLIWITTDASTEA